MHDAEARKSENMIDWPDVQPCDCGSPMRFVSIELGYSCINPDCVFHVEDSEVVA